MAFPSDIDVTISPTDVPRSNTESRISVLDSFLGCFQNAKDAYATAKNCKFGFPTISEFLPRLGEIFELFSFSDMNPHLLSCQVFHQFKEVQILGQGAQGDVYTGKWRGKEVREGFHSSDFSLFPNMLPAYLPLQLPLLLDRVQNTG